MLTFGLSLEAVRKLSPQAQAIVDKQLITAAKQGNIPMAEQALKNGANINSTDKNGNTPLIYAMNELQFPMVQWFLKKPEIYNNRNTLLNVFYTLGNLPEYECNNQCVSICQDLGTLLFPPHPREQF